MRTGPHGVRIAFCFGVALFTVEGSDGCIDSMGSRCLLITDLDGSMVGDHLNPDDDKGGEVGCRDLLRRFCGLG